MHKFNLLNKQRLPNFIFLENCQTKISFFGKKWKLNLCLYRQLRDTIHTSIQNKEYTTRKFDHDFVSIIYRVNLNKYLYKCREIHQTAVIA